MQTSLKKAIKRARAGVRIPTVMFQAVEYAVIDKWNQWPKSKQVARRRRRNKLARKSRRRNRN